MHLTRRSVIRSGAAALAAPALLPAMGAVGPLAGAAKAQARIWKHGL